MGILAMKGRSEEQELIDKGSSFYTQKEYENCLKQLDRIGHYLGGDRATFKELSNTPQSILDIGCGGGGFTQKLALKFPDAHIVGIDISKEAIDFAKQQNVSSNVTFEQASYVDYANQQFDLVLSTLVCHHFNEEEIVHFLKTIYPMAKQDILINDLHRHWLASLGYRVIAPLFFYNRLIVHDGLLSIKKSFKKKDWTSYLNQAKIPSINSSIKWYWPFRWIIKIKK